MRRSIAVVTSVLLTALGTAVIAPTAAQASVPVRGSHPRWATASARVGAAPGAATRTVYLFLASRDPAGLQAVAKAVSDPHNAAYGHYLTAAQAESRFGPTDRAVGNVRRWLRTTGLHTSTAPGNSYVAATGTNAELARAFGVQLARYRTDDGVLIGADRAVDLPVSIADSVTSVAGLSQSFARPAAVPPPNGFRNAQPCSDYWDQKIDTTDPAYNGQQLPYVPCGYKPGQLRSALGMQNAVDHGVDGTGVRVAIVDAFGSPSIVADATEYAQANDPTHPLTAAQYSQQVAAPTPGTEDPAQCDAAGWYGEQTLDVEAVHAAAPGASIVYRGAPDCSSAALEAELSDIVANHSADIVSNSWGSYGEDVSADEVATVGQVAQLGATEGIGFYFCSGDSGDETTNLGHPEPDFPASDPWVTAVGGASVGIDATGSIAFLSGWETGRSTLNGTAWTTPVWTSGAGGGTSTLFAEPAYQQGIVPTALSSQNQTSGNSGRVVPDLASLADPNTGMLIGITQTFPEGVSYDQYRIGGTSLASPLTAGAMALADQLAGQPHGFLNPALYGTVAPGGGVTDVQHGDDTLMRVDYANGVDVSDGTITSARILDDDAQTLKTTNGYDDVTGLGVLNSTALALHGIALTPTSASTSAGTATTYTTSASDAFGAQRDVTDTTTLSIQPTTGGASCTGDSCSATAAGQYTVTATYTGGLPTTATLTATSSLTVTAAAAATITATGGTPQSATAGSVFAQPLQATVDDQYGNPTPGVSVTFTLPPASATSGGATFTGGVLTATAMTNPAGVATSPTITAGSQTGPILATATTGSLDPAEYTLSVTAPPATKADLAVSLSAPSTAKPGSTQTITVTVTNSGPSTASKLGTAVIVPRGWTITKANGGTVHHQLAFFTSPSLAKGASAKWTLTVVTSSKKGTYLLAAGTSSGTSDPNYRNNVTAAVTQLR